MEHVMLALSGASKVLMVGLILGAGLPLLFGLGVRSLAFANTNQKVVAQKVAGKAMAALCFALIITAVGLGITQIVATGMGKTVSYSSGFPTLVDKK